MFSSSDVCSASRRSRRLASPPRLSSVPTGVHGVRGRVVVALACTHPLHDKRRLAAARPCRHGRSRGGSNSPVCNAERVITTIKVTRTQRDHRIHLWPCPCGIVTAGGRQDTGAKHIG